MAKIILSAGDKALREIPLSKGRVTIGRRPHNDVVIDDLAISGEHAVIVTMDHDSFLEDLNSTNGTQVNGQPVKKHFLRDNDVIELAHYRIRYVDDASHELRYRASGVFPPHRRKQSRARVRVLNGAKAGKESALVKSITTIGKPGIHTAAILFLQDGYYITYVEGNASPSLNGELIGQEPVKMRSGDVIDLSGTQVEFLWD